MTDGRYRTLLRASSAIARQSNVETILRSVYRLLSAVVPFESAVVLLFSDDGTTISIRAVELGLQESRVQVGLEFEFAGTAVEQVLKEQRPVYVADIRKEMSKIPSLVSQSKTTSIRSGYVFPLSSPRKPLGVLVVSSVREGEFSAEDVSLFESVAGHISTALQTAMSVDEAERYQQQLECERDRFRLLLEINNHVVSHLDLHELLSAACSSLRKHFDNDLAGLWIIDDERRQFKCAALDFPDSRGFMEDLANVECSETDLKRMRSRQAELMSPSDFDKFHPAVRSRFLAEGIASLAVSPLATSNGPLGVLLLGGRSEGRFRLLDKELLEQVATQISLAIDNALAYSRLNVSHARLADERLYLESEIRSEYNFEDIIGKSNALRKVLEQIAIVAPTTSTVLLRGETGTGKELVARAVHSLSARKDRTFVRLNCAAIPSGLVESELFGHERGAFTGALTQKRGRLEIADKGTLFLDEIGDISIDLQPKLLRALQEQEFERLGSTRTIQVDVRLIAATHRDLGNMIRNGQFREDLFYRLNVFPIDVPPLRERREDIPLLVHFFVTRHARQMQKRIQSIPKHSMEALISAPWPGNIRELENFIERCVILTTNDQLRVPVDELVRAHASLPARSTVSTFQDAERQAIIDALKAASGKISGLGGAAERLGLKRTTLQNKMRRLNIGRSDYAQA